MPLAGCPPCPALELAPLELASLCWGLCKSLGGHLLISLLLVIWLDVVSVSLGGLFLMILLLVLSPPSVSCSPLALSLIRASTFPLASLSSLFPCRPCSLPSSLLPSFKVLGGMLMHALITRGITRGGTPQALCLSRFFLIGCFFGGPGCGWMPCLLVRILVAGLLGIIFLPVGKASTATLSLCTVKP